MTSSLTGVVDPEEAVMGILRESSRAIGSEAAGIALPLNDRREIAYVYNLPVNYIGRSLGDEVIPAASGAKTEKTFILPASASGSGAYGSLLLVPLPGERPAGCLFFTQFSSAGFCAAVDIRFAERSAGLASLALERVRFNRDFSSIKEQMDEQRASFNALLDDIPAGVVVVETSGRLLRGNEQMNHIWRKPVVGARARGTFLLFSGFHSDGSVYAPEDWPLARSLHSGAMIVAEEIVIVRGDGSNGVLNVSSGPIRDIRNRIIGGVMIIQDITERKEAEKAGCASRPWSNRQAGP